MSTVKLWTDEQISADPRIQAVIDDIRATRKSDFINNFWRALANQPDLLERTWSTIKQVMIAQGALDPLTKELIYIAVSVTNSCTYCIHSHTAAARTKGMTDQQHAELLSVIALASETNALANALQVPVDPEFLVPQSTAE
jgi:AhpD family alkylhydroperoxidase